MIKSHCTKILAIFSWIFLVEMIAPCVSVLGFSNDHVISRMLGSSQSLVYLTLKKGDLIQAKQVIKMFNLKGMTSAFMYGCNFKFIC